MTEPNRDLREVPGLIAERKRYESWLEALDARRETTPNHVFERVHADYRARLQRVADELASFRQLIEEERTNVDSRLSLLEAEERMRRDERAELELRSHVGELAGEDASLAFASVDEALTQLVAEKGTLQSRISELDALLEGPTKPLAPSPAPRVSQQVPAAVAPTVEAPRVEAPRVEARVSASVSRVSGAREAEVRTPPRGAATATAAAEAGSDGGRDSGAQAPASTATATSSPPAGTPRVSEGLRTASGTFDELKFLNTVIGRDTAARPRVQPDSSRGAADGAGRDPAANQPLAANVPGNTPIAIRASVPADQTKTLKCSECGAMNYPTEWYCERCGAELAAL